MPLVFTNRVNILLLQDYELLIVNLQSNTSLREERVKEKDYAMINPACLLSVSIWWNSTA